MPELPEVETIVRDLAPRLVGRTLENPRLHKSDVLRDVSPQRFLAALRNSRIEAVTRRAKHVVIQVAGDLRWVIQPRMTGTLMVLDRAPKGDAARYVVFRSGVGRGKVFVYRDVRRLGTMRLLDEEAWRAYTGRIGPEPLASGFDADGFAAQFRNTRQAVKKALMDQRRLAGVGNIYANEALFRAGIDPSRRTDRLRRDDFARLYRAVREVLEEAIDAKGTTLRDYRTGTGQRGRFQRLIQVYGRSGEQCVRCRTRLATTHAVDGRATTFCWRCQGRSP